VRGHILIVAVVGQAPPLPTLTRSHTRPVRIPYWMVTWPGLAACHPRHLDHHVTRAREARRQQDVDLVEPGYCAARRRRRQSGLCPGSDGYAVRRGTMTAQSRAVNDQVYLGVRLAHVDGRRHEAALELTL